VSQELSQTVSERFRQNADLLLDRFVGESERAEAANLVRPQALEVSFLQTNFVANFLHHSAQMEKLETSRVAALFLSIIKR
jgi:hypothetical protein